MLAGNTASAMSNHCRLLPRILFILAACVAVSVLPGCGDAAPKSKEVRPVADYFPVKLGDSTVRLQLAVKPMEMQTGLMDRPKLGADDGMVFIYARPQELSFWMRNTLIPLDVGYCDSKGVLREVWQMYPHDERAVKSRSKE